MSGEWFSGLTDDGRPIVIDGHQVKTVSVTRQADGMLSVEFGDSGSVIMASPELVQEWADNVNTLTAQRDAARDIAARLGGELARVAEVCDAAWLWMHDSGCDRRAWIMQRLRAIADTDPDAVIAEGES